MLSANLFRALPPSRGADQDNYDPDEEEPTLEPTWPHLQVRRSGLLAVWTGLCLVECMACQACRLPLRWSGSEGGRGSPQLRHWAGITVASSSQQRLLAGGMLQRTERRRSAFSK